MIDENFIADRIAALRLARNTSAREMSLSLGQSPSYINNIENRKSMPSMQMFLYICDYLEISPRDFFDEEVSAPDAYKELMKNFRRLDRKQLDLLIALAAEMK